MGVADLIFGSVVALALVFAFKLMIDSGRETQQERNELWARYHAETDPAQAKKIREQLRDEYGV